MPRYGASASLGQVVDVFWTQNDTSGGSSDTGTKVLAARPTRAPSTSAAIAGARVAQTSIARATGIIIRNDVGSTLAYDLLVDWQSNLRSALVRLLARARTVIGIHPADGGELPGWWPGFRPVEAATRTQKVHRVERALHVVKALGWEGAIPEGRLGNFDQVPIDGCHGPNSPVLLHPFVSAFGRFKEWPVGNWVQLARMLAKRGLPLWISGSPDDQHKIARIIQQCGYCAAPAPHTSGIRQLTALMDHCRAVVAADTGVLHLATIRQIPAIGLYGPKDPTVHGPWGRNSRVLRGEIPCSPCTLRTCEHSFCMQSISPRAVETALLELLVPETGRVDPTP